MSIQDITKVLLFTMVLLTGGAAIGYAVASDRVIGIEEELVEANARAAAYETRYDVTSKAYRALAIQVTTDTDIKRRLRAINQSLRDEIEDAEGTILSLQRINATLTERLEGRTETVVASTDTLRFDLFSRNEWGEGSFMQVEGPVVASPDFASWDLEITGAFGLTTVVDRRNETDLAVSVFFDNDNFEVTDISVINNVFDPLTTPPDRGFLGDAWELVKGELFDLTAWRHRAEGALICLVACPRGGN